jgi:hypothetical protein
MMRTGLVGQACAVADAAAQRAKAAPRTVRLAIFEIIFMVGYSN